MGRRGGAGLSWVAVDVDGLIEACQSAMGEGDRAGAVRAALEEFLADPAAVIDELGQPAKGGITPLHHAPDLTVLNVVWTPGMALAPHDHLMFAAIGVYAGDEENRFYRRAEPGEPGVPPSRVVPSGGRVLAVGDVHLMGDDTIHSVQGNRDRYTGGIHVYAGDFFDRVRSTWDRDTLERDDDPRPVPAIFEEYEAAWQARNQ